MKRKTVPAATKVCKVKKEGAACQQNENCKCDPCKIFFLDEDMQNKVFAEMVEKTKLVPPSDLCLPEHYFTTLRKAVQEHERKRGGEGDVTSLSRKKLLIQELLSLCSKQEEKVRTELENRFELVQAQSEEEKLEKVLKEQESKILQLFLELDSADSMMDQIRNAFQDKKNSQNSKPLSNHWPEGKFLSLSLDYETRNKQYLDKMTNDEGGLDEKRRLKWALQHIASGNRAISCYREIMGSLLLEFLEKGKISQNLSKFFNFFVPEQCAIVHRVHQAVLGAPLLDEPVTLFRSQTTMRPFVRTITNYSLANMSGDKGLAAHCLPVGTKLTSTSFLECSANQTLGIFGRTWKNPYWSRDEHGYILILHVSKGVPLLLIEGKDHVILPPYVKCEIIGRETLLVSVRRFKLKIPVTSYHIAVSP